MVKMIEGVRYLKKKQKKNLSLSKRVTNKLSNILKSIKLREQKLIIIKILRNSLTILNSYISYDNHSNISKINFIHHISTNVKLYV